MTSAYDRMLQMEAEEWFEGYDHETTEGLLLDLTGEPLDEEDTDLELFRTTGIF